MPKLSDAARVSAPDGAVWRPCTGCGALAALTPDTERCPRCRRKDEALPADAFTPGDVEAIRFAGNLFAATLTDIAFQHLDATGWAYHDSAPVELDRLSMALDEMAYAIDEARKHLSLVDRRATARARTIGGGSA